MRTARNCRRVVCATLASVTLGSLAVGQPRAGCAPAKVACDTCRNEGRLSAVAGEGLDRLIALSVCRSLLDGYGTSRELRGRRVSLEAELRHDGLRGGRHSFLDAPGTGAASVSARLSWGREGPVLLPLRSWILVGVPFSALADVFGGRIGSAHTWLAEPASPRIRLPAGSAQAEREPERPSGNVRPH